MDNLKYCLVILFLCISLVDSQQCLNNCSGRGVCYGSGNNTYCACVYAFFGPDCSITVYNQYPQLWIAYQVIESTINILEFLFFSMGAILAPRYATLEKSNITAISLTLMAILTFIGTLHYTIDPYGTKFLNIPYILICLFDGLRFPAALVVFGMIVFRWVEAYQETIKRLNEQEMLAKIKQDYNKEVTLEDILANIRSVHRLRIPFGIVLALVFIYRIIGMVMRGILNPAWSAMNTSFNILIIVLFALIAIGSIYYGRKLYQLFPKPLDQSMRDLTFNVVGLSTYSVIILIIAAGYYGGEHFDQYQLVNFWVGELFVCLILNIAGIWMIVLLERPMFQNLLRSLVISSKSDDRTDVTASIETDSIENTE